MNREELRAAQEAMQVDPDIVRAVLARVPPSWSMVEKREDGAGFRRGSIQVLVSVAREQDGQIWVHVSASGRRGPQSFFLPSWEDLKRVKNDFIGANAWAYQVFPDEKHYINRHPYVLHLFSLFENRPALPDFTQGLGTL